MPKLKFLKTAAVAAIITLVIFNAAKTSWDIYKKSERLTRLEQEVVALREQKSALERKASEVQTPEFIEKEARDRLKMTRPGEKIVILPAEEVVNKGDMGDKGDRGDVTPVWRQWVSLIFS